MPTSIIPDDSPELRDHMDRLSIEVGNDPIMADLEKRVQPGNGWITDYGGNAATLGYVLGMRDLAADYMSIGLTESARYVIEFAATKGIVIRIDLAMQIGGEG